MTSFLETAPPTPTAPAPHPRRWLIAVVMIFAALMDMIDATIVNVALPSIGRDLHARDTDLQWMVSSYLLAFAATLIIAGHLGDRYGHRRLFLIGVALFGVASLGAGLSGSPGQLIATRAIQGAAAATLMPQVLATFRTLFDGKERGAAFGLYGAIAGIASAVGILLGGVLVEANLFGWQWRPIFLVNIPVAVVILMLGAALVPASRPRRVNRPDLLGGLVLAGGMVALVLPLSQGRSNGWPLWGWACLAAGILAVIGLVILEAGGRVETPLLPVSLFRIPAFSAGLFAQLLFAVGMQGFFLSYAVWLQYGQGYTPLQAGVLTIAFSAGTFLTAPAADGLARRLGRTILAAGGVLMAVGVIVVGVVAQHADAPIGAWSVVPGLVITGAGLGLLVVPLVNVVLSAVPTQTAGGASGIFSTAQQFGGALGVAVIGTVFFSHAAPGLNGALAHVSLWTGLVFLACAVLCLALPRTAMTHPAD